MARIKAPQFPRGSQEDYLRYLKEEEEQDRKKEIFARQLEAQIEAEKRKREKPTLAQRIRERAINEGTFTAKDGPVTKEEAIKSLRGGLRSSGRDIPEQTEFSDDESGYVLANQMGRAGKKISMDEFEQAKIKREQMEDYIKMMQGDINTMKSSKTDNMGALDDRSSDQIKEGLLSNLATRKSRQLGMGGDLPETTSKQYAQRIMSQVGLNKEIEKAKRASMGRGTQSEINRQRALRAGEEVDRGELADKNRPGLSMEEIYENEFEMGKEQYDKDMAGDETLNSFGFNEGVIKEMALGRGTPAYRSIEEVTLDASDIDEELDSANITSKEERDNIKMQVGNYMPDSDTGLLINLDRVQARLNKIEERERIFKTANLLTGKARENFLVKNDLIDEADRPKKTELEKLEEGVKFYEAEEKIANLLSRRKTDSQGNLVGYEKETKSGAKVGELLTASSAALKNGNPELAFLYAKQAGMDGLTKDMFVKEVDGDSAANLYGPELFQIVGSNDGKDIASFIKGYHKARYEVPRDLAKIVSEDTFSAASDVSQGYYRNAGITKDTYPEYVRQLADAQKNNLPDPTIQIIDPVTNQRMDMEIPEGGFRNEAEFWTIATRYATDGALRNAYPRFHDLYNQSSNKRGEDTVNRLNVGGGNVTGVGEQEAGSGEGTLQPGERPGLIQQNLQANKAPKVQESPVPSVEEEVPMSSDEMTPLLSQIQNYIQNQNEGTGGGGGDSASVQEDVSGLQAAELKPTISSMILKSPLNEEFTFGKFTNGRRGVENEDAFYRTQGFEGDFTPKVRQEFFEKKAGQRKKPVTSNGRPVYHIGYGIRLPIDKKEAQVLRTNGFKGNPNILTRKPTQAHIKKLANVELTEPQAEALMKHRYANHIKELIQKNKDVDFSVLPTQIRQVLFDMAYNIGPNFMTRKNDPFDRFKSALVANDIDGMVDEIKDSKYYREQVSNRASANIKTLLSAKN